MADERSRLGRRIKDRVFAGVCVASAATATLILVTLLTSVITQAMGLMYSHAQLAKHIAIGVSLLSGFVGVAAAGLLLAGMLRHGVSRRRCVGIAMAVGLLVVSSIVFKSLADAGEARNFLTAAFVTGTPSRKPESAGIWPAMIGTLWVCGLCGLFAVPVGVATAVFIEEFKPRNRMVRRMHTFLQLNITNLAGVPSIVYGILGLTAFANLFGIVELRQDELPPAMGVTYYDRFETEGKALVWTPLDGRTAPATVPSPSTPFQDIDGNRVELAIVSAEQMLPRQVEAEAAAEAFVEQLATSVKALEPVTVAGIVQAAGSLLPLADLRADSGAVLSAISGRIEGATLDSRRAVSRLFRQIRGDVENLEAAARFKGLIRSDAYAAREARKSWYYLQVPFGRSVLAGGLTLGLVILPIIIISTQESLRAVPQSVRQASLALGATPWQTVWHTALPAAVPGIMTGTILAMSRAIGEAAPLLIIAGIVYITFTPENVMDQFTVMPLQIFEWARRPQTEFYQLAAAGIVLLMGILISFNAVAIAIRHKSQGPMS